MVDFDDALDRRILRVRHARGVHQPEQDGEVGEQFFLEHAVEVELQKAELHQPRAVAEQTEQPAVGDDGVEVLGQVQVFLQQCVRRHARAAFAAPPVQTVVAADDVDGKAVAARVAVADGVVAAVDLFTLASQFDVVTQQSQKRRHPEVAGLGGAGVAFLQALDPATEDTPLVAQRRPRRGRFRLSPWTWGQAQSPWRSEILFRRVQWLSSFP